MVHSKEQRKLTEHIPEEAHTSDLLHKDFKTTVLKVFKELKEDMHKKRKNMYEQNRNIGTEVEIIKMNPHQNILQLKSTINEI